MNNVLNLFNSNNKTKIIENLSFNDRSIVTAYVADWKQYVILLFHVCDRPNKIARESAYSTWGYPVGGVGDIHSREELDSITKMYINDILSENYFWEVDQ